MATEFLWKHISFSHLENALLNKLLAIFPNYYLQCISWTVVSASCSRRLPKKYSSTSLSYCRCPLKSGSIWSLHSSVSLSYSVIKKRSINHTIPVLFLLHNNHTDCYRYHRSWNFLTAFKSVQARSRTRYRVDSRSWRIYIYICVCLTCQRCTNWPILQNKIHSHNLFQWTSGM